MLFRAKQIGFEGQALLSIWQLATAASGPLATFQGLVMVSGAAPCDPIKAEGSEPSPLLVSTIWG